MDIFRSILTPLCELCGCQSPSLLCSGCQNDLPLNHSACSVCALPVDTDTERKDHPECSACLVRPKPYLKSVCAYPYVHPVDHLIRRFKQHAPQSILPICGDALLRAVNRAYLDTALPECLLPVPQHWRRFLQRGFHPTRLIAEHLGSALEIPVAVDGIRSSRLTRQKTLRRSARLRSLQGVYELTKQALPARVALVDDVITTGATAETLTHLLLDSGVTEVHIWGLARTP